MTQTGIKSTNYPVVADEVISQTNLKPSILEPSHRPSFTLTYSLSVHNFISSKPINTLFCIVLSFQANKWRKNVNIFFMNFGFLLNKT